MRLQVAVVSGLLLLLSAFPVLSQDSASCGDGAFLERVDSLYAELSRIPGDDLASFIGVEGYHAELGEIIESCRSTMELMASGVQETGTGTIDDPYAFNFFGEIESDDHWLVRISDRASQSLVGEDAGYKAVRLTVDLQCVQPQHLFCAPRTNYFNLLGDNAVVYEYESGLQVPNRIPNEFKMRNTELAKGGKTTVWLDYKVREDDSNLLLIYNSGRESAVFFSAEPAHGQIVNTIPITSIANPGVNIRSGPGTSNRIVGTFSGGQQADAIGRNNAGTWVQFDRGWVSSEWVEASGDIMLLPVSS